MRKPTIKDVARQANVSLKTVSRVINREPSVLESTRERVQQAIAALSFEPDQAARNLRSSRPYALGLAYDNPNPHYVIQLQQGVLSACRAAGFGLQIHPCDSSSDGLATELIELVRRGRVAGLVVAPPMSERIELMRELAAQNVPFIRMLSAARDPHDGLPCVYVDDRDAAYDITKHLIQLGHQRIGFLWGGTAHKSSYERYDGYEAALKDYGLPLDRKLVLAGDFSFDDGFRGARKLLALKDRPSAIFGSNDEIAAGVLAAAKSAGLEVPYDLSIAGFEDSPFAKQSWPALTTAKQATAEIAHTAAELLLAAIERERLGEPVDAEPHNRGFSPQLVVRGSTAPLKKGAPE